MTVGKVCGSRKFRTKMGFCCNQKTKNWQPGYPHRKFCSKKTLSKPNPWAVRYGVKSKRKSKIKGGSGCGSKEPEKKDLNLDNLSSMSNLFL